MPGKASLGFSEGSEFAGISSFDAHNAMVETGNMFALFLLVGLIEVTSASKIFEPDHVPGDYDFDPLKILTPDNTMAMKTKEIKNGRLAMLAFSGIVSQDALAHGTKGFPYMVDHAGAGFPAY